MTAPRNTRGTVVIGSTESDAHVVPIFLLSLELENRGYRVENLRCFNSAQSFAEAARALSANALVISNHNGQAYDDLHGLKEALGAENPIPVVLGGHYYVGTGDAADPEAALRDRGVTHFVSTVDGLIDLLEAGS